MGAWCRRLLPLVVIALWPVSALAKLPYETRIYGLCVTNGKVFLVQVVGGITVLDVASGRILLRERGRPDERLTIQALTPEGLVIRSHRRPRFASHLGGESTVSDRLFSTTTLRFVRELELDGQRPSRADQSVPVGSSFFTTGEIPLADGMLTVRGMPTEVQIDVRTERGSLQSTERLPGLVRVGGVWDREDKLFVETRSSLLGMLTCFDLRHGRALWRYVFASYPDDGRPHALWPPTVNAVARARDLLAQIGTQRTADPALIVDPCPFPSASAIVEMCALAWVSLVLLPAAALLLRRRRAWLPDRSPRRAAVMIGSLVWYLAAMSAIGGIEAFANVLGAIVFAVTAVLAFRDSIRLSGSTWVRIPLVLVVLGLAGRGLFSLLVT